MGRHELTDKQWLALEPCLPPLNTGCGRKMHDRQKAILWNVADNSLDKPLFSERFEDIEYARFRPLCFFAKVFHADSIGSRFFDGF